MTTTATAETQSRAYSDEVAGQIRAVLGRRNITKHELAVKLGENDVWIGRRLAGGIRRVPIDLNDLARISHVLDVPISDLLPRYDSNVQPAGNWAGAGRPGGGEIPLHARQLTRRPLILAA